ncbi:PGF-pre-PGF domain-containing protein [Methanosarcina hadiensis]|uniref:PGF-pre-PGF domain-containing protein n=1 Tax=Methanosarcina hadiensis TaxID=3078083 RepID=UPI003977C547
MRNKGKLFSLFLASVPLIVLFITFVSSVALASTLQNVHLVTNETQITTDGSNQYYPSIYSDKIVWLDARNNGYENYDIYMYDLSTSKETQVTTNGLAKTPKIYNDRIVYMGYRDGNYSVCMYNITTYNETRITTSISEKANPTIFGERVVWEDGRDGNKNIYMYDLSNNTEIRITTNYSIQREPAIYGDRIVWLGYISSNWNIYMYNISTHNETRITTSISEKANPSIYGDRIVWQDRRNGYENWDIYMYNITTSMETQITTNESHQYSPIIYGDRIVWEDWRNNCHEIYMYDLSNNTEIQVTTDGSSHYNPTIYGDRVVWSDARNGYSNCDIYMCNLTDSEIIVPMDNQITLVETQITTNLSWQGAPSTYDDKIVWQDMRNGPGNWDIYMYDLSADKETQITTNESNQYEPVIYDDKIVWQDSRNGNWDIYMYNLSTSRETQITTNESYQLAPSIYGGTIAWADYRNSDPNNLVSEIYIYNLSTCKETRITNDKFEQGFPFIYGNTIVWQEFGSYGNTDIYMYNLSTNRETKITTDGLDHSSPTIYGDRIVWKGYNSNYWRIYMYNISTTKKTLLCTINSRQEFPAIYGDMVVWEDWRNEHGAPGNLDIYMYNISSCTETRITTKNSDQKNPAIYDNRVVWEDWRSGNPDIFMCTISTEKAKPKLPVTDFSTNVTNGYAPLSVQFTDLSQNAVSRSWDFGDGDSSIDQNPAHTYSKSGAYTVNLTASNVNGSVSKLGTINVLQPSLYAYITNMGSKNVSVIDTSTNLVIATINVGHYPLGVVVNPDGTKAYVANMDGTVSIIDTSTNNVIGTMEVGNYPYGIAVSPDGAKVYVANYGSNNVSIIDTTNNTVIATVPVGATPLGVAVSPDGKKVYIANYRSDNISVIDTATNDITGTVSVGNFPVGIAVNPDGTKVYVANINPFGSEMNYERMIGTVSVINTTTNNVTATVKIGESPSGIAVNPTGTKVYVANYGSNNVSVFNTSTNTVTAIISVGDRPYGVAVNSDGTKVYVANQGSNNVSIIDTATNKVTDTVNVGNSPIAFGQFIGGKSVIPDPSLSINATQVTPELTEAENGKSINFRNGEIFYLILTENPGTPYSLQLKLSSGLTILSKKSIPMNPPLKIETPGYIMGIVHIWKIKIDSENDQEIKGTYIQPVTKEIARTYTVYLKIGDEGDDDTDNGRSGGSSGGSPEPARNVEVKELCQAFVVNGTPTKFDFTKNATCVVYVGFDSKKTVGKTTIIVEQLKNKSTLVSNLTEGDVYKYFNVWAGNSGFASPENIENPTTCFKIEKSWLQNKSIDQDSITLNRYTSKTWEQLPVSLSGEDSKYLYFIADVPGFSFFAITGRPCASLEEVVTEIQSDNSDNSENKKNKESDIINTKSEEERKAGMPGFDMVYGVAGLLGVFLYRRR